MQPFGLFIATFLQPSFRTLISSQRGKPPGKSMKEKENVMKKVFVALTLSLLSLGLFSTSLESIEVDTSLSSVKVDMTLAGRSKLWAG